MIEIQPEPEFLHVGARLRMRDLGTPCLLAQAGSLVDGTSLARVSRTLAVGAESCHSDVCKTTRVANSLPRMHRRTVQLEEERLEKQETHMSTKRQFAWLSCQHMLISVVEGQALDDKDFLVNDDLDAFEQSWTRL